MSLSSPLRYTGRFAPSPTGALHAGSLVAALASWLDARAHGGRWLVRIEDIDPPRCVPGADTRILAQLAACALLPDEAPQWQSHRGALYQQALEQLQQAGWAYPCACTRKDLHAAWQAQGLEHERHIERPYPGTCRNGLAHRPARAWRFASEKYLQDLQHLQHLQRLQPLQPLHWYDRRLGWQQQDVAARVGDFVLRRADGWWAYQLAVVVDDAAQGITDVVRGQDLADNTPRQILLQRALQQPTPRYLHAPLVCAPDGEKLSKQHGAAPLELPDARAALLALSSAAHQLGLPPAPTAQSAPALLGDALAFWVEAWAHLYNAWPHSSPLAMTLIAPPVTASHNEVRSGPPADVTHPKAIKSYVRRAGRTTSGQAKAVAQLGAQFILPYPGHSTADAGLHALDAAAAFGRTAPLILEIGFGMGEATAHIARVRPEDNFLCCEVHEPGVGALLKRIGEQQLSNIRILQHDAVEVLAHMLAPASLDGVHIFFPDPWHKKRHHKRRLIQPPLVAQLAARLKPGGYLHCATDWQPYAEQMLQVLSGEALLHNCASDPSGYADKPAYRPLTKFENRGLRLGHGVWDVVFTRTQASVPNS